MSKVATLPVCDETRKAEIAERFDILHEMTRATIEGNIRAMIVTGPPGIGKSYGILEELEKTVTAFPPPQLIPEGEKKQLAKSFSSQASSLTIYSIPTVKITGKSQRPGRMIVLLLLHFKNQHSERWECQI